MNTHFDCPVLTDTMRHLIDQKHPECSSTILNTLSTCPMEMAVLTLMAMKFDELLSRKETPLCYA